MGDIETVIPGNVNLAKMVPNAVSAYSRRFKSIATNAQTFSQQQYVNITLDTSTPGAYIDPLQSYLKFDLTLINTNPFIDYCSFGSAGANAVIEEFRIYCQGTPVEEILYYNTMVEAMMDMNGQCVKPFFLYRPSKVKQPVSKVHQVNAIKAPMVNLGGNPMHFSSFASSFVENLYSSQWTVQTNPIKNQQAINQGGSQYVLLGTNAPTAYELNYSTCLSTPVNGFSASANDVIGNGAQPWQFITTNGAVVGNIPGAVTLYGVNPATSANSPSAYDTTAIVVEDPYASSYSVAPLLPPPQLSFYQANINASSILQGTYQDRASSYTNPLPPTTAGFQVTQGISQAGPVFAGTNQTQPIPNMQPAGPVYGCSSYFFATSSIDTDPLNPLNWPFYMPNDNCYYEYENYVGPNNLQDYMMFLSNTKLIPVGIPGTERGQGTQLYPDSTYPINSLNFKNCAQLSNGTYSSTYTVCLPLISGILGCMAEKAFPAMLVAPGSFYIQLRLATDQKALQVSMDPCRRVLGTIRDYIPFGGTIGGVYGQFPQSGAVSLNSDMFATNTINYDPTVSAAVGQGYNAVGYLTQNNTTVNYNADSGSVLLPNLGSAALTPQGYVVDSFTGKTFGTTMNTGAATPSQQTPTVYVLNQLENGQNGQASVPVNQQVLGNPNSVIGSNLLALQSRLTSLGISQSLIFSPYSIAAMEGTWSAISFIESEYANEFSGLNQPALFSTINPANDGIGNNYQRPNQNAQAGAGYVISSGVVTSIYGIQGGQTSGSTTAAMVGTSKVFGPDLVPSGTGYALTGNIFPLNQGANPGTVAQGDSYVAAGDYGNKLVPFSTATMTTMNGGLNNMPSGTGMFTGNLYRQNFVNTQTNLLTPPPSNMYAYQTGGLASNTRMMVHPGGFPLPQYFLTTKPWAQKEMKATITNTTNVQNGIYTPYTIAGYAVQPGDLASEPQACYGSFLDHSRHQSFRCFNHNSSALKYQLTNVEFVGQQIILPDSTTATILEMAASQDISIQTTSIHTYLTGVQSGSTQNLIIPAKIASANSLVCVFQPTNLTQGNIDTQLYNSLSRFCPYSSVYTTVGDNPLTATSQVSGLNASTGIGRRLPIQVINCPTGSSAFEIQLRIGNELLPQQPLTSVTEIVAELLKCSHKLMDTSATLNATFSLTTTSSSSNNNSTQMGLFYEALRDRDFTTAFTSVTLLDDQTYINNPNWNYISSIVSSPVVTDTVTVNGNVISKTQSSLFGWRNPYVLPIFTPNESTFMIGFDMDTWSKYSDVTRSGKYLGNNTITLYMTGAVGFERWEQSGIQSMQLYTFVTHDMRVSFQAGGSMVSYY